MFRMALAGLGSMQVMMCAVALYMDLFISVEEEFMIYFKWISLLLSHPIMIYSAQPFTWGPGAARSRATSPWTSRCRLALMEPSSPPSGPPSSTHRRGLLRLHHHVRLLPAAGAPARAESQAQGVGNPAQPGAPEIPSWPPRIDDDGEREVAAKTLPDRRQGPGAGRCRLPADGLILRGQASLNEAMLTGEQLPLLKQAGIPSTLAPSTRTRRWSTGQPPHRGESRLARSCALQDHALDDKPAIAQLADVLSRHFIVVLLVIAALVWTFWRFHAPERAFWVTLAVLVATCPAPCRWPPPTALTSATAHLTRSGILLRRAAMCWTS